MPANMRSVLHAGCVFVLSLSSWSFNLMHRFFLLLSIAAMCVHFERYEAFRLIFRWHRAAKATNSQQKEKETSFY